MSALTRLPRVPDIDKTWADKKRGDAGFASLKIRFETKRTFGPLAKGAIEHYTVSTMIKYIEEHAMTTISVTIKDANAARLETLAQAMDRSKSWIANEALEQYLAHQDWMEREVGAAIAEIDAGGELVSHEDVVSRADARMGNRRA
jgi:predicted transcriptional regulator